MLTCHLRYIGVNIHCSEWIRPFGWSKSAEQKTAEWDHDAVSDSRHYRSSNGGQNIIEGHARYKETLLIRGNRVGWQSVIMEWGHQISAKGARSMRWQSFELHEIRGNGATCYPPASFLSASMAGLWRPQWWPGPRRARTGSKYRREILHHGCDGADGAHANKNVGKRVKTCVRWLKITNDVQTCT